MKKLIALFAIATGIGFITPTESSARDYCHNDRRVVGYHSCGAPIYSVYHVHGYDRYGHPVGHWVTDRSSHSGCRSCYSRSSYSRSRHHHHGPVIPVPPHHRAAASFFFGFGR